MICPRGPVNTASLTNPPYQQVDIGAYRIALLANAEILAPCHQIIVLRPCRLTSMDAITGKGRVEPPSGHEAVDCRIRPGGLPAGQAAWSLYPHIPADSGVLGIAWLLDVGRKPNVRFCVRRYCLASVPERRQGQMPVWMCAAQRAGSSAYSERRSRMARCRLRAAAPVSGGWVPS